MEPQNVDDRLVSSEEYAEEIRKLPEEALLPTGFKWLDKCIGGFGMGDLVVLVGEPKTGKSILAMSLTNTMAKLGTKALWIQAELSYPQFFKRFKEAPPTFYVPRVLNVPTITWVEQKVIEAKKLGAKVVYIDDLGMIADEEMYRNKHAQEIYGVRIMRLKRLAVRHEVCVVGMWHVDKESGRRKTDSAELTDIKGMTDLAYRADTVLKLERAGKKTESHRAQDMAIGELILDRSAKVHVLACRRTGVKKVYIGCYMGDDGYYHEEEL